MLIWCKKKRVCSTSPFSPGSYVVSRHCNPRTASFWILKRRKEQIDKTVGWNGLHDLLSPRHCTTSGAKSKQAAVKWKSSFIKALPRHREHQQFFFGKWGNTSPVIWERTGHCLGPVVFQHKVTFCGYRCPNRLVSNSHVNFVMFWSLSCRRLGV